MVSQRNRSCVEDVKLQLGRFMLVARVIRQAQHSLLIPTRKRDACRMSLLDTCASHYLQP